MEIKKVGGLFFVFLGMVLTLGDVRITGAVVGGGFFSWMGLIGLMSLVLGSIVVLMESNSSLEKIANTKGWTTYPVTEDSIEEDAGSPEKGIKRNYLNNPAMNPTEKLTPMQERIERSVNRGDIILPYAKKDDERINGEMVNKRNTYEEQFHEGHASKGGRIIEANSHITKPKLGKPSTWFKKGRLSHFGELANGNYVWVIDKEGNLVLGNRTRDYGGMTHSMHQMPKDLGSGERHEKIEKRNVMLPHATLGKGFDVYGAGEVVIKDGLIDTLNADSGHYRKLIADVGGKREPYNYNKQSIEAFKYAAKKIGWKEIRGGTKLYSKHFNLNQLEDLNK